MTIAFQEKRRLESYLCKNLQCNVFDYRCQFLVIRTAPYTYEGHYYSKGFLKSLH